MYFLGGKDMRSMDLIFSSNNYHQFTDIDDKVIFESAARKGYNDIINSFIEKNLIRDKTIYVNALKWAIQYNNFEIIKTIIESGKIDIHYDNKELLSDNSKINKEQLKRVTTLLGLKSVTEEEE